MFCKIVFLITALAAVNAGYIAAPVYPHATYSYAAPHTVAAPSVVSQQSNILRSHGNSAQISAYSKSINTPHSSVYKSDVRISNDALAYPYAHGYATAPAYGHAYTAPTYGHAYATSAYPQNYIAPAFSSGYISPGYAHGYAAPTNVLGVAYSPATAAAHFSYSNGYGLHYSY